MQMGGDLGIKEMFSELGAPRLIISQIIRPGKNVEQISGAILKPEGVQSQQVEASLKFSSPHTTGSKQVDFTKAKNSTGNIAPA